MYNMVFLVALHGLGRWRSEMPRCSACAALGGVLERKSTPCAFGGARSCLTSRQGASESVKRIPRKTPANDTRHCIQCVGVTGLLTASSVCLGLAAAVMEGTRPMVLTARPGSGERRQGPSRQASLLAYEPHGISASSREASILAHASNTAGPHGQPGSG